MTIFMWITIVAMLLVAVVANTDSHPKLQLWVAVILYVLLAAQTVIWIGGYKG